MKTFETLGLLAFIATGAGLVLTTLLRQSMPWVVVSAVIGGGYVLGLINYYRSMCASGVKEK